MAAQDGLKVIAVELAYIRKLLRWITRKDRRVECLRAIHLQISTTPFLKPLIDVPTRWNSFLTMIDRVFYLKDAIIEFVHSHEEQIFDNNDIDWIILESIQDIMFPLEVITKDVSGDSYPTLSFVIPYLEMVMDGLDVLVGEEDVNDENFDLELQSPSFRCAFAMLNKFRKYMVKINNCQAIAVILDPRYFLYYFGTDKAEYLKKYIYYQY